MSPILDLQVRMRELGRIRTGVQVATSGGKRRPSKLEHFRLTSASRTLLEHAAAVYGGDVRPWAAPNGPEFELVTTSDSLDIIVPPGQALSQWYELWSGGGCQRRCDGRLNVITDSPCECPEDPAERRELASDGRACKPTTRLNVMLPLVPDLGIWRLEVHGYYAAVELAGAAAFLERTRGDVPARLRLDKRHVKRPGEPPKDFVVPVIEIGATLSEMTRVAIGEPAAPAQLAPVNRRERVERPAALPAPAETEPAVPRRVPAPDFAPPPEIVDSAPMPSMEEIVSEALGEGPEPLTNDEFIARVRAASIGRARIEAHARTLGLPAAAEQTDEDRGRLWAHLSGEAK